MGEGSNRFRGAAFGGFHRQDVLDHLAKIEKEYRQANDKLSGELGTLRSEAEEDKARCIQAESQLAEERQLCAELMGRLETAQQTVEEQKHKLLALEQEVEKLRETVTLLEPRALAYDRVKDRTAAIELDAHERAQVTLEATKAEVEKLRGQTLAWMREIQKSYQALLHRMEDNFGRAKQELSQIGDIFQRTSRDFGEYGVAMEALIRKTQAIQAVDTEDNRPTL